MKLKLYLASDYAGVIQALTSGQLQVASLGASSYGHTGFTGGSLWIDPEAGRILILLAHRTSVEVDLAPWRRRFHRLALSLV